MHLQDAIGIKTCILCDSGMYEIWTVKQVVDPELNTKMCVLLSKDCAGITLLQHKRNTHSMTTYTVLPCRKSSGLSVRRLSRSHSNNSPRVSCKCHMQIRIQIFRVQIRDLTQFVQQKANVINTSGGCLGATSTSMLL